MSMAHITTAHHERMAYVYVRQSTLWQVNEHQESTERQYRLQERALELGWPPTAIAVIDEDQGRSGSSATARTGFRRLVSEVSLGQVGMVLMLEASRLARNSSDWHQLIELCGLSHTLLADESTIYDPRDPNDRLLLGVKGSMSEAELHWLKSRLQGGKQSKAEQGSLRFRLPIGLVYDPVGRIVLDPDEAVAEAVRLVFSLFEQSTSALAVVSAFAKPHLRFPTRWWGGKRADELIWSRLTHERVLNILHSPLYAGAYVYGRAKFRSRTLPGEESRVKGRTRRVKQEDWPIVLLDAHPGYITWDQFLRNQRQLDDNRTWRAEEHRGAIREGPSRVLGIILCGSCGRRMSIRDPRNGSVLMYECHQLHSQLAARTCQTMRGDRIDQAVVACELSAIDRPTWK
jgi:DNA invertase Pin-like site-specific DNA recombinase